MIELTSDQLKAITARLKTEAAEITDRLKAEGVAVEFKLENSTYRPELNAKISGVHVAISPGEEGTRFWSYIRTDSKPVVCVYGSHTRYQEFKPNEKTGVLNFDAIARKVVKAIAETKAAEDARNEREAKEGSWGAILRHVLRDLDIPVHDWRCGHEAIGPAAFTAHADGIRIRIESANEAVTRGVLAVLKEQGMLTKDAN